MKRRVFNATCAQCCTVGVMLFTLVGCGGPAAAPTSTVSGKVSMGETPVEGSVVFQSPSTGKVFNGSLNGSGQYKIEEVEVGDYKVYLTPPQITQAPEGPEDAEKAAQMTTTIPDKYRSLESTDLTATVSEGEGNTVDFTLEP